MGIPSSPHSASLWFVDDVKRSFLRMTSERKTQPTKQNAFLGTANVQYTERQNPRSHSSERQYFNTQSRKTHGRNVLCCQNGRMISDKP